MSISIGDHFPLIQINDTLSIKSSAIESMRISSIGARSKIIITTIGGEEFFIFFKTGKESKEFTNRLRQKINKTLNYNKIIPVIEEIKKLDKEKSNGKK